MRTRGATYADIKAELGYVSEDAARRDFSRAMTAVVREPAEDHVALEMARLDAALVRAWQSLDDPEVTDRNTALLLREVLRVSNQRATLLGLNKSTNDRRADAFRGDAEKASSIVGRLWEGLSLAFDASAESGAS